MVDIPTGIVGSRISPPSRRWWIALAILLLLGGSLVTARTVRVDCEGAVLTDDAGRALLADDHNTAILTTPQYCRLVIDGGDL